MGCCSNVRLLLILRHKHNVKLPHSPQLLDVVFAYKVNEPVFCLGRARQSHKTQAAVWEERWHPLREEWVIVAAQRQNRLWSGETVENAQHMIRTDGASWLRMTRPSPFCRILRATLTKFCRTQTNTSESGCLARSRSTQSGRRLARSLDPL